MNDDKDDRRGRPSTEPGGFPPVRSSRAITPQEVLDALGRVAEVATSFERALIAAGAFMPACVTLDATATLPPARLYWLPSEAEGARIVIRRGAAGDDTAGRREDAPLRLATAYGPEQVRALPRLLDLAAAAETERLRALRLPDVVAELNGEIAWRKLTEIDRARCATDPDDGAWRDMRNLALYDLWVPPPGHPFSGRDSDSPEMIHVGRYADEEVARPDPPPPDRVVLGAGDGMRGYARLVTLDATALRKAISRRAAVTDLGADGGARFYRLGPGA